MEFLTPFIKPREIRIKLSGSTIRNEYDDKSKVYHDSLQLHNDSSVSGNKLASGGKKNVNILTELCDNNVNDLIV